MAELSEKEIKILCQEIDKQGLTYTALQKELLDHLCCDIETKMDEGRDFLKAYEEVSKRLEDNRIQEIQEETLLLVNQKYRIMKKFMYILGTIAPAMLITGAVFKLQHWPGASVLITLGTFLLAVVYLPVFAMVSIRDTRKKGKKVNKALYITGVFTGFVFLTGVLFKIMHWPGAGLALTLSVLFTVVVFIPVLVTHALRDKENQLQNFSILIFILAMMAVNIMVFALKVSKNVLTSMIVASEQQLLTGSAMESGNALYLEGMLQDEQAALIHEKTSELDAFLQEIMGDILLATHEDNRMAVGPDGEIDIRKANYFDSNSGVHQVLFGDEGGSEKGEKLQSSLEGHRDFLLAFASPQLGKTINLLLDTSPRGEEPVSWLGFSFGYMPMIGAINTLANLQVNIRFLEGEVLKELTLE